MNPQFNRQLYDRLRELLNKARVFWSDPELNSQFEFVCALLDRISDAIQSLEVFSCPPKSVDEVYLFLVNANAINEVVQTVFRKDSFFAQRMLSFGIQQPVDTLNYFSDAWKTTPFSKKGTSAPSDVRFFSYFRALSFAHSCETTQYPFLRANKETNYSPFVIPNHSKICLETHKNDKFGVLVYSNKGKEPFHLLISFAKVKAYLVERFNLLHLLADCIERMEQEQQAEWRQRKVVRSGTPTEILHDIARILNQRTLVANEIEELIKVMTIPVSSESEQVHGVVKLFRDAVERTIPTIADAVDAADYNIMGNSLEKLIHPRLPFSVHLSRELVWLRGKTFPESDYVNDPIARDAADTILTTFGFATETIQRLAATPNEMWLVIVSSWYVMAQSN